MVTEEKDLFNPNIFLYIVPNPIKNWHMATKKAKPTAAAKNKGKALPASKKVTKPVKSVSAKNVPKAKPAVKKSAPVKKVAPKKAVAKKPTPKKVAAKKPAPKKVAAKKPTPKKVASKKPAPKKVAVKKPAPKKVVAKKAAPVVAKKPAQPAAKKAVAPVKKAAPAPKKAAPAPAIVPKPQAPAKTAATKAAPAKPSAKAVPAPAQIGAQSAPSQALIDARKNQELLAAKIAAKKKAAKKLGVPIHQNLRPLIPVKRNDEPLPTFPKITSGKKLFKLEFEMRASPKMLYNYISTPSGLAAWFANDVNIRDGIYSFIWSGSAARAKTLAMRDSQIVAFQWLDEEDKSYFVFEIVQDDITGDVALVITDFAFPGEMEQNIRLWNSQIHDLMQVIGS